MTDITNPAMRGMDAGNITFDFPVITKGQVEAHDTPAIDAFAAEAGLVEGIAPQHESLQEVMKRVYVELGQRLPGSKELDENSLVKRGKRVMAVAGIALMPLLGGAVVNEAKYTLSSDIPTSAKDLDPTRYTMMPIPAKGGVHQLARIADPDHNPNRGAEHIAEQLGHSPKPGELVAVPK